VSTGLTGRRGRIAAIAVAALLVAIAVAVTVALTATSQAAFFERYQGLERRHTMLASSGHSQVECVVCHTDPSRSLASDVARVGEFYRSLVTTSTDLAFFTFKPPTNAACVQCHLYDWSFDASRTAVVPHPAHLRVEGETRECVSCHKWVAHEEAYQAKHTTMPFSGVCVSFGCHVGVVQRKDCGNCHHALAPDQTAWRTTGHPAVVRANGPNACFACHKSSQCDECHTTGKATDLPSIVPTLGVTVEAQHVKPTWVAQHGTVALADPKVCTTCHISNGECLDCHALRPAFHGPSSTWLVRHQPLGTTPNLPRCLTCHQQKFCDACHAQFKQTK
jgi:nitrate/TMAO reductase-like tetraheme cytochrome c subunit